MSNNDEFVDLLRTLDEEKRKDLHEFVESTQGRDELVPVMKPDDTINASGIEEFCARREAIRCEENIVLRKKFDAKMIRIFSMGRVYEQFLRDRVLGMRGVVIGKWRCMCCGHIPEDVNGAPRYALPKVCVRCESKVLLDAHALEAPKYKGMRHHKPMLFEYVEEYQRDEVSKVGGYIDAFLYWNMDYYILEVKTVASYRFKMVQSRGPFEDHMGQIQMYMKRTGYKKGILWYYNKDNSEEKLFYVEYNPRYAEFLNRKGFNLQAYFEIKEMPTRLCPDSGCKRAKKCPVMDLCFNKYQGVGT